MKVVRSTTVPMSLNTFCKGLLKELQEEEGYEVVALSSPGKELNEIASREGVRTIAVPMERRISPFKDIRSLLQLIKVFRSEKPDMVHSMTPKAGLLCMVAARIAKVPVRVHTFTGLVFPTAKGIKRKILMLTDKITCACATHVVPEGEGVKNDLKNFKITRKNLQVLGHGNIRGIDLQHYNPENEEIKDEAVRLRRHDTFTFIFIGRIAGDKGISELVSAFSAVRTLQPSRLCRLIIVGRDETDIDPISAEGRHLIENFPGIECVGPQSDVRPWLLASDALILPSYREGFPNVVIEAGAMGLPSIVTDINGANEIIVNGTNGLIVPPRDSETLSKAMVRLMNDDSLRAQLASHARPMVESRYKQSYVRKCLKDFYKDILR